MSLQSLYAGMEKHASDEDALIEGFLDKLSEEKKNPGAVRKALPALGLAAGAGAGGSLGMYLGSKIPGGARTALIGSLAGLAAGAAGGGIVGAGAGTLASQGKLDLRKQKPTKNVKMWNDRYNREWAKHKSEHGGGMGSLIGFDKSFRSTHGDKMPF